MSTMEVDIELNALESSENKFETVEENEWLRLITARFKEGYGEGKYSGNESTVQSGFDRGYVKGFELSYPVSVLKGILAANQLLQKESKTDLLQSSKEIKQMLNEFEKNTLRFVKTSTKAKCEGEKSEGNLEPQTDLGTVNNSEVTVIREEVAKLRKEVQEFLKDSNQPQIVARIQHHFEKWEDSLAKSTPFNSDENASTRNIVVQC